MRLVLSVSRSTTSSERLLVNLGLTPPKTASRSPLTERELSRAGAAVSNRIRSQKPLCRSNMTIWNLLAGVGLVVASEVFGALFLEMPPNLASFLFSLQANFLKNSLDLSTTQNTRPSTYAGAPRHRGKESIWRS